MSDATCIPATKAGHAVYIGRDGDRVLYVGYSSNVMFRLGAHAARSKWWPLADDIDIEWFGTTGPDRGKALHRERELIAEHQPPYNTALRDAESLAMQRQKDRIFCENDTNKAQYILGRRFLCGLCARHHPDAKRIDTLWEQRVNI